MLIKRILPVALAVLLFAAACSSDDGAQDASTPTTDPTVSTTTVPLSSVPTDYAGFLRQPVACGAERPAPATEMQFSEPGDAGVGGVTTVTLVTSCGPVEIALDPGVAPETVNSFVFLAESGYFDGTVSHRVIPGFMMQAGDPTATGLGGPGYRLPDELPTGADPYQRGVVAMANAGPDTAGSQFFILFGEAAWLPPSYSVFGEVVDGFAALDAIEQVTLGSSSASRDPSPSTPLETVFIESVVVDR